MNREIASAQTVAPSNRRPYDTAPLGHLVERIACAADRPALAELQDHRTPCSLDDGPPLSVLRFITAVFELNSVYKLCGQNHAVVERARDLITDKFGRLRINEEDEGTDCRTYYAGVLRAIENWNRSHPEAHPLERESASAIILQRNILCHARFSCLEALRSCNPLRSRFAWRLPGGTIHVWIPVSLDGTQRHEWLGRNVPNPAPLRPGERRRVQSIIDERLGVPLVVRLPGEPPVNSSRRGDDPGEAVWLEDDSEAVELAEVVAEEKAGRIRELRPSIQALGPSRLKSLILSIFSRLRNNDYDQSELASAFLISESTLTRFAGQDWKDLSDVPDLWVNVARLLAGNDRFVEAAVEAGVWSVIRQVLDNHGDERKGGGRA